MVDPGNTGMGQREVQRRDSPDQWVFSPRGAHPAVVSEADFIAVQNLRAEHAEAEHGYRLKELLRCAICDRAFEGHRVDQTPGYPCWHGRHSGDSTDLRQAKTVYLREDRVVAKLPVLHHRLTAAEPAAVITGAPAAPPAPYQPFPRW